MRRRVSSLAAGLVGLLTMGAQCLQPVNQCENHTCDPPDSGCVSTTCQASGAQCGAMPDGCGQLLECGTCPAPLSCGGSGVANRCGCTPEPDDVLCGRLHACGDLTAADACGAMRPLRCAACPPDAGIDAGAKPGASCSEGPWPSDGGAPTWVAVASLAEAREAPVALKLPDGRVLVAGGSSFEGTRQFRASVELYDPLTRTWSAGPVMTAPRAWLTLHRLDDGTLLAIGGDESGGPTSELLDLDAGTWRDAGAVPGIGFWHASEQVAGGVVAMGGYGPNGVARYVTELGTWLSAGTMPDRRYGHRIARLSDGGVLVTGGSDPITEARPMTTPIFDPATDGFATGGIFGVTHHFHTLSRLCDGTMLVSGGLGTGGVPLVSRLERYDPARSIWRDAGTGVPRAGHTATMLPNGQVLLLGGKVTAAEIYDPVSGVVAQIGDLGDDRVDHTATLLDDGTVLVAGGVLGDGGRPLEKVFGAPR